MLGEITQEINAKIQRAGNGSQLTAEHICLLIAAVAGTVAAWLVDASNPAPNDALRGLSDMPVSSPA
jgi:hypothetical protein